MLDSMSVLDEPENLSEPNFLMSDLMHSAEAPNMLLWRAMTIIRGSDTNFGGGLDGGRSFVAVEGQDRQRTSDLVVNSCTLIVKMESASVPTPPQ